MNVSRLVASVGGYFYSTGDDVIAVHLYGGSTAKLGVGGREVTIRQTADYPWSGKIRIVVEPASPASFALKLRIPGWASGETVRVNGVTINSSRKTYGYVELPANGLPAISSRSSCRCVPSASMRTPTSGQTLGGLRSSVDH